MRTVIQGIAKLMLTSCLLAILPTLLRAQAVEVKVVKNGDSWQLMRDGKPYFIKGAGGSGSLAKLKAAGGNSMRTWGADTLGPLLDEAQKLGITVTVGIWLGHEPGFSYNNADQVAKQTDDVRQAVLKYRDHPAVLMWGLGNEMEGYAKGDNPAIWNAIENLAAMVKKLDPKHPTMTVTAEIGGDRVKSLNRFCPDIDIMGINSYGGGASIPKRYKEAGGIKPYILTEFGPAGTWETGKTSWGAALELTSTEKAQSYKRTWEQAIANQPLCLGGYAFTWGNKQEATATWFGMLLPDGSKLGAVDAMTEVWTGKPASDPVPVITSLKLAGPEQGPPGAAVKAMLDASDPSGKPIKVRWVLQGEPDQYNVGGQGEKAPPTFNDHIVQSDAKQAEVKLPAEGGGYRLFAYVTNDTGGAAVANIPLKVNAPITFALGSLAKLPFVVYDEKSRAKPAYFPSGWMGNTKAIKMEEGCTVQPHAGKTCLRFDYDAPADWAGVVWQSPAEDWGDKPGGWNLTGAKKITFWARGEKGGETLAFQFGLLGKDKKFFDTANGKIENVKLTPEWKQYSLDLTGKELTRIKTGFCWVVAGQGAPVIFYLDDIKYE